jgi:Holliday junction DNA helicase RuvA
VIASLRGTVSALTQVSAVIDVAGVGYFVNITPNTSRILVSGNQVQLFTAMIVREDAMTLFGFADFEEQELFELLRSVTGVGPKSALGILGEMTPAQIRNAVAVENDSAFKAVSGIGPKTAKLITVTLAGKLKGVTISKTSSASRHETEAVVTALTGLGWSEKQATEAVQSAGQELDAAAGRDALLKLALSKLSSNKKVGA